MRWIIKPQSNPHTTKTLAAELGIDIAIAEDSPWIFLLNLARHLLCIPAARGTGEFHKCILHAKKQKRRKVLFMKLLRISVDYYLVVRMTDTVTIT